MKIVYVAGPFRAATAWLVEQNVRRAEKASLELWKYGIVNVCPHTMGRFFDKTVADAVILAGTLEIALRCDGVVMLPGWGRSLGAEAELQAMKLAGKAVFYLPAEDEEPAKFLNTLAELRAWGLRPAGQ